VFPAAASEEWPLLSGRRRWTEGLAMFLQFETQMDDLVGELPQSTLSTAGAMNYFLYLPPAGLIAQSGFGHNGFIQAQFFSGRQTRGPFFIEGVRLEPLLKQSLAYQPIDLTNDQQMMWLYVIRENMQAASANVLSPPIAGMIFTSGYIPYQAEPQFNLSHWNNANFALVPKPAA
jgi:hypothetical protein